MLIKQIQLQGSKYLPREWRLHLLSCSSLLQQTVPAYFLEPERTLLSRENEQRESNIWTAALNDNENFGSFSLFKTKIFMKKMKFLCK